MNTEFEKIKSHCHSISKVSEKVNDEFLINFIAEKENMVQNMHHFQKKYRHIIRKMPDDFFSRIMAEYIIGKTLVANGLINKYINHSEIRSLSEPERELINFQIQNPWRYSFAHIINHPEKEFFLLRDEFVNDEFLIYSPGMEAYFNDGHQHALFFILMGFNGECWQSYGLIIAMKGFNAADIYFYGTELSVTVDSDHTLMESVYKDPMPYFMLASGMEYPVVISGDNEIRIFSAVSEIDELNTEKLKMQFRSMWNRNVYKFTNEKWSVPPHFATAYYNEKTGELLRHAMTAEGFDNLSEMLINLGLEIDKQEDFTVSTAMLFTMEDILKKKVVINSYENYFTERTEIIKDDNLDSINKFMNLVLPHINSGKIPDIAALAKKVGIDNETAQSIYDQVKDRFG